MPVSSKIGIVRVHQCTLEVDLNRAPGVCQKPLKVRFALPIETFSPAAYLKGSLGKPRQDWAEKVLNRVMHRLIHKMRGQVLFR